MSYQLILTIKILFLPSITLSELFMNTIIPSTHQLNKAYKPINPNIKMQEEMITISKEKYEKILEELVLLRELKNEKESDEDELLTQVKVSLEDLKAGRIRRVA